MTRFIDCCGHHQQPQHRRRSQPPVTRDRRRLEEAWVGGNLNRRFKQWPTYKLTQMLETCCVALNARGNTFVYRPKQLDRKLYERVNKALVNAGGKWKGGKVRAHIFEQGNAAGKLTAMLGSGISVDEKKRDQSFFTPPELAAYLVSLADVQGHSVLEPSAGLGALVDACMNAGATFVNCVELNEEYVTALRKKYPSNVVHGDFLAITPATKPPYERIVMNPPFTKNQDIAHVNQALKWLKPDGILVSLMAPNQSRKGFQELVKKYNPEIIEVERGAFKESGTNIATLIVKIKK